MSEDSAPDNPKPMKREGSINLFDTHIGVWEEDVDEPGMQRVFHEMIAVLAGRGWSMQIDPDALERWKCLAPWRWIGSKGDLRVHVETSGRTAKMEFHSEVNAENPNGGRYDFNKFNHLPARLRFPCIVEMTKVVRRLFEIGYVADYLDPARLPFSILAKVRDLPTVLPPFVSSPDAVSALALARFNKGWQPDRFKRDETGWPIFSEYGTCNSDKNGAQLRNGQTRYFRRRGRLMRATVFTNMNNMWQVCYGGSVTYEAGFELFSCEHPEQEPRRLVPEQAKRVRAEIDRAMAKNDFLSVAKLAKVCARLGVQQVTP